MKELVSYTASVEEELKRILAPERTPTELYGPVNYMLSMGGKRMRPVLTLMSCELFGGSAEDALPAAAGIELFHNFTLLHDDIMDNAPLRRNKETVHRKWNSSTAILSGDVMLVEAYRSVARTKQEKLGSVLDIFSHTAVRVCEGQQLDMNYEKRNISIDEYLQMIEMKTAVLLAASLKIGAVIGNAGKADAEDIYTFGKNIGIAFQLQDDLLDVYGDEKKTGKQRGGDIMANKKTFLFLKAMQLADRYTKEELLNWTQSDDGAKKVEAIISIYDLLNISKETEKIIAMHAAFAFGMLDKIREAPERKAPLKGLAESLMNREF